jgi:antitoxin (DNA-binding transcriptional repressor) of toxin-antitoxin stability system
LDVREGAGAVSNISKKRMRQISIAEFKTHCSALLHQVSKTKIGLQITKRGKVVAEVIPPSPQNQAGSWLGHMAGPVEILGDIIEPVIDLRTLECYRDR